MGDKRRKPDATGPELFSLWVDAGTPKYREFAAILDEQNRYKSVATAFSSICYYSGRDDWQGRKAKALDDAAQAKLDDAARIDATSFLKTSVEIAKRLDYTTPENIDTILKIRESVRKPAAKGPTVSVSVTIREQAEVIAARLGVPASLVLEQASAIAGAEWDRLEAGAWSRQP